MFFESVDVFDALDQLAVKPERGLQPGAIKTYNVHAGLDPAYGHAFASAQFLTMHLFHWSKRPRRTGFGESELRSVASVRSLSIHWASLFLPGKHLGATLLRMLTVRRANPA